MIGRRSAVSHGVSLAIHAALVAAVVWVIAVWQWPVWLAVLGVVLATSMIQDLHALSVPVEFALTSAGMHIRHGQRTAGPWMRRVDRFIPWSEVREVRTHELRINGVASTTLHIDTAGGTVSIAPGTFDAPADRLQTQILDHIHALGGAARREEADVDEFCRTRWAAPLRLVLRPVRGQLAWIFAILWLPLIGLAYFAWGLWPVWLGLASMYVTGIGLALAAERRVRVLELRADGLAVGSAPDRLAVTAWRDILLVRRRIETTAGSHRTTALEVRLRDGRSLVLNGDYGRSLDELAELLDPPLAKLALARAALAAGADLEAATRAAGLPARDPVAPA